MEASVARRGTFARIDLAELEKLCAMQCTDEEIAAWFKVTTRTIERRRKVRKFAEIMDRGKARGKISVRRMQMKLLEEGNATMGVWLGKQLLGVCPRNSDFGGRTATLRVARISDSASGADTGFGHVAQGAFSEANLTGNHAPDRRGNATVAY